MSVCTQMALELAPCLPLQVPLQVPPQVPPQVLCRSLQVRVYKEVETRALGDSQQTPFREGSPQRTKELRGDLDLGVSNLVEYCPIQEANRA